MVVVTHFKSVFLYDIRFITFIQIDFEGIWFLHSQTVENMTLCKFNAVLLWKRIPTFKEINTSQSVSFFFFSKNKQTNVSKN